MNLHQICQECKERKEKSKNWKKCSCDQPISLEYCKIIEQLLSVGGLKFNCINTKRGCKEAFIRNDLGNHESKCIYRPVPCPYNALVDDLEKCTMVVTFHEVIKHYIKEHLEESTDEFPDEFLPYIELSWIETCRMSRSGENSFYDPFECTLDDQTFLYCGKTADKLAYRWDTLEWSFGPDTFVVYHTKPVYQQYHQFPKHRFRPKDMDT